MKLIRLTKKICKPKVLGFIDDGQQMWQPGNYFKRLKS
jgi:hypothetical protein